MISGSYRSFLQGILRKIAIFYDVTPTAAVVEEEKFEWTSSERKSNSRGARGSVTPLASILRCFCALNYVNDPVPVECCKERAAAAAAAAATNTVATMLSRLQR